MTYKCSLRYFLPNSDLTLFSDFLSTSHPFLAAVGTSSEPESCPRLPRPPPVILTEHRAATPPHCDAGPVASSPYVGLLHPIECLSITRRKSSTGDSAVDLKFGGDEERSLHSGGPPSPFTSSTPSDAEVGARGEHEARVTGHPQGQVRRSVSSSLDFCSSTTPKLSVDLF